MPTYAYKVRVIANDAAALEAEMNARGAEGYRLVFSSIRSTSTTYILTFEKITP